NDVGWDNPDLNQIFKQKPADWKSLKFSHLSLSQDDLPFLLLNPDTEERHKGVMVSVNHYGMRDRAVELAPAPGVQRVLMLGASHLYGSGVEQEQDFESLLEDSLNHTGQGPVELLNCAVEGYSPLDVLFRLRKFDLRFEPSAAIYVGHIVDGKHSVDRLADLVSRSRPLEDPWLVDLVARAGARPGSEENACIRALRPFERELLDWIYARLREDCESRGITLRAVYLPLLTEHDLNMGHQDIIASMNGAGLVVWDLNEVYAAFTPEDLWVAPWDDHPGARGHALVAADLYSRFIVDSTLTRRD
ncbi:MAG: hypothetical protein KC488_09160, partial [Candidatus Cloacimonetes bacterium]|nr:hypothetical protein [Candidatus Cloacimonadota bacterium]